MNIKQLIQFLSTYPEDMEVLYTAFSDYQTIDERDFSLQTAVDQGGYTMRAHETMSEENKARAKTYLVIAGN